MRDTGTMQDQKEVAAPGRICIVANLKSGRNSRDAAAVDAAAQVLGAEVLACTRPDRLGATLDKAVANRPDMIVSAGGDGTAVATAGKLLGTGIAMAVLPLGTFNYFARGLGLDPDPAEAARQIVTGRIEPRRLGQVNGQIFLNNASVGGSGGVGLADTDDAVWETALRVNLSGAYPCLKQEIRWMRDTGGGAIVNNASVLAINGGISAPYCATKHGIAGLTKSAALSYGNAGIRVNAVCPGFIEAGMGLNLFTRHAEATQAVIGQLPLSRPGSAEEVADVVLWLCSPAAAYVTGTLLPVDGGYCAR